MNITLATIVTVMVVKMEQDIRGLALDSSLLEKYGVHGPRYTSYPTAPHFTESFGEQQYAEHVLRSNEDPVPKPLSLYIHIPFCNSLCYYCGCNKIVTPDKSKAGVYLDYLYREIELHSKLYQGDRLVEQIHFGGGTPNFLSVDQLEDVMSVIAQHFHFGLPGNMEVGIEIDPRCVDGDDVKRLAKIGFNRISIGVQDFDAKVQQAVNRIQSKDQVMQVMDAARESHAQSISVDLIYGLPEQNMDSFNQTLNEIIHARPDRIALYHYAHMPQAITAQKMINEKALPSTGTKLAIFDMCLQRLRAAGYVYIGMDHFALPDDSLAQGLKTGDLHRNFQGYSTHADCDIIGFGVSAISRIDDAYSQNQRNLSAYMKAIDQQSLPIQHGLSLDADDKLRADVIQHIMCDGKIDFQVLGDLHHIYFEQYFEQEIVDLKPLIHDDLLVEFDGGLKVTAKGRLFLRNIAMVFDAHLSAKTHSLRGQPLYSKTL